MCKWLKSFLKVSGPNHESRYGNTPNEIITFFENLIRKEKLLRRSIVLDKFLIDILQTLFKSENIEMEKGIVNSLSIEISKKFKLILSYNHENVHELKLQVYEIKSGKYLCGDYYRD